MTTITVWDKQFKPADGALVIKNICITGSGTDETAKNVYHFRLYLQPNLATTPRSVLIDMTPAIDPPTGCLLISSKATAGSTAGAKVERDVPTVGDPTVADIIAFLKEKKFDRYIFTDDGYGCKFWCQTVLDALGEKGWIAKGAGAAFVAWDSELGRTQPGNFPPIKEGKFYA